MEREILIDLNPWWQDSSSIQRDRHIVQIGGKPYTFKQPLVADLDLSRGKLHIMRGPRQVGKTTLIKQWIARLIAERIVDPANILFLSCEGLADYGELMETIATWRHGRGIGPHALFLDEVSFVHEWQRALLHHVNTGVLDTSCVVVTGSNARDLKESAERFPGRRGGGKDISLWPLSPLDMTTLTCFKSLSARDVLDVYLKVGGFPHAIRDFVTSGEVSDETYRTYQNWIVGDAARFGLAEETLRQVFHRLREVCPSRVSWSALIETTSIQSHETALSYVQHLEDAFLARIIQAYDESHDTGAIHKARKVFFVDPLLHHLASAWKRGSVNIWKSVVRTTSDSSLLGGLLESAYAACAGRYTPRSYFWYSTKSKKEVDLVLPQPDGPMRLFDVKWSATEPFRALGREVRILRPDDFVDFEKDLRTVRS